MINFMRNHHSASQMATPFYVSTIGAQIYKSVFNGVHNLLYNWPVSQLEEEEI
jgi:hypothetical protein